MQNLTGHANEAIAQENILKVRLPKLSMRL